MTKKKTDKTQEKEQKATQQTKNKSSKKTNQKKEEKKAEVKDPETKDTADQKKESEEKAEVQLYKEKYEQMNDKYLRLAAEYDNYRKRTLKERMDLTKTAGEDILVNILPVIDDFERALGSIDDAKEIEAVKEGVYLIYNKFKEFLKQRGVKEIEAKEQEFDTDIHEAITKIPAPKDELKGKVVDVVEKGYVLHDKVIRFSKVVIGE